MGTVQKFLLNHFNVAEMSEIKPYGPLAIHCWEFARDVSMNITNRVVEGQMPRKPWTPPGVDTVGLAAPSIDWDRVSVRTIAVRYARNPDPIHGCYVRLNYYPLLLAKELEQQDKMIAAAGGIPGVFMTIAPRFNGPVNEFALRSSNNNFFVSDGFVKTTACLNDRNVLNGIIELSPENSVDFAKCYNVCDETGELIGQEANNYYLIPADHVLAWKLKVFQVWQQKGGIFSQKIIVNEKVLYYAVPDLSFIRLYKDFVTKWCNKVDLRPLKSVGFEFVGSTVAEVDATITYTCFPQGILVEQLIPSLSPDFIPYEQILHNEK